MRRPTGGLWSHPDFMRMWTGQTISEFGSQISALAVPILAARALHATPFEFAALGVVQFLPFILFALPAGVWVDRLHRRSILIVGDAARALLLILIPILWALDALQIWHLLVLQFVIGVFTVFFDVAYQSYLPALIDREHLVEGNSKLQLTISVTQVAGPPVAGALIAALTAAYAIFADSISYVVSTFFMLAIRHRESRPQHDASNPHPKMWPQVKEGLDWVVHHPWLRAIAACTGTANFFGTMTQAILVLYMIRTLHLSNVEIGVVLAVGSVGAIGAGLLTNRINKRIGVGPTIVSSIAIGSVFAFAFPLAPQSFPLPVLMLGMAAFGFGGLAYNITQVSLRQAITPDRLQGRMNAAMRWIVWGTIPLGMLIGGTIGQYWSLHAVLWIGAIGQMLAILPVALSSIRTVHEMPEPVQEPTPAEAELAGGILVEATPLAGPAAADA